MQIKYTEQLIVFTGLSYFFVIMLCTQVSMMYVLLLRVYIHTGIFFKLARCEYTLRVELVYKLL